MHAHFLDPYKPRSSPIHQLDARLKVPLVIAFILTTSLIPIGGWPFYIFLTAVLLSAEILSDLGIPFFFKRAALALPFVLAALPVLFTQTGNVWVTLPFGLTITAPGVERFISVALKAWISVQAAILMASTTPFPEILLALRALRLPKVLVSIIGLMWRYLFVIVDETIRMMNARNARSGESPNPSYKHGGSVFWRAKVTGGMAGNLFIRSIERSDRIYHAMLSRGYDGEIRHLPLPSIPEIQRWISVVVFVSFFLIVVLARVLWG
ncbi:MULTISPECIES: cobalt ECF transporter T component CbiQ [Anaerolinea]|jgi:cobalt/nickel transport system permease protein|uniref:cobalt ECF transporter T component CbiQ n=1 Tax=Anaerolinea TaxID=233189 RepID=UPI002637C8E7|nr:cobalt ECF transporter T component CbiQ [Anaerolinea thermophila]